MELKLPQLKFKSIIFWVVIAVAIGSAVYNWYDKPVHETKTIYVEVPKEIVKIKKVSVPVEKIVVLEKKAVSKEISLPEEIKTDASKEITTVGVIESHDADTTVISVIDKDTGESRLIAQHKRPSLFGFKSLRTDKEIGIKYGFSTQGMEMNLFGRWTFVRVGAFHLALYSEINNHSEGKAMAEVSYKW